MNVMINHKFASIAFVILIFIISVGCLIFQYFHGYRMYWNEKSLLYHIDEDDWREFEEFREWKRLRDELSDDNNEDLEDHQIFNLFDDVSIKKLTTNEDITDVPPSDHPALVGRYVVNHSVWASVGTISTYKEILSYPFVNVVAISDGSIGNGTGIPYIYLTPLDFTAKDINKDKRVTFMMTLAQGRYCHQQLMDPIDPRCARIILSGEIKKISMDSVEYEIAKSSIFNRHPKLVNMPTDHKFFFAKLDINLIAVLDTYGGAKFISKDDYFNPPKLHEKLIFNNEKYKFGNII